MKKTKATISSLLLIGQLAFMPQAVGGDVGTKIIYGEDNRYDTAQYPDREFREYAKSVAGMVSNHKLTPSFNDPEKFTFFLRTAEQAQDLCMGERFSEQYVLPSCSGFLVAPDILVTAGHCMTSEFECKTNSWVFDYTDGTTEIDKNNVYKCEKIIDQKLNEKFTKIQDYAVIKLDRAVEGRTPLKFRKKGKARTGTKLAVIGHPLGLPQKIADGAKVKFANLGELIRPIRSILRKRYYFTANLDTYAGNSGSPVFNKKTGEVEGILVQGAEDFDRNVDNFCNESKRRSNSGLVSQEKVYRITKIPFLKDMEENSDDKGKKIPDDDE
ncbi:MAG: trypsin-like serine protease [Oligoflexia bacterium]|nr:trypsin-like serine protease [Oligoflexia bacterium]